MQFKRIIDISWQIHPGMPVWPGDQGVSICRDASISKGDSCNLSSIRMGLHTGTHVDAPFHFIEGGKVISELDLEKFFGWAKVFELDVKECIKVEDIQGFPIQRGDIVLFKTSNSSLPKDKFIENYVYVHPDAAEYLLVKGVKSVGIDYLSVEKFNSPEHPVHKILLSQEVGIIEGLMLKGVAEGTYLLSCLPLKIEGVDGSPVRAVLAEI